MDNALVVVTDGEAGRTLLREAGELAAGVGAKLVLLSIISESEFEHDSDTLEQIGDAEGTTYDQKAILDAVEGDTRQIGREELGELDVAYECVGAVADEDDRHRRVIDLAEEFDCDYVFLIGRRRSPAGKAIFGDTAQKVILGFDGRVVLAMD